MNLRSLILFPSISIGVLLAAPLQGQAPLTGGLPGSVVHGVDAASRGAGGIGMGGPGVGTLLANPAELAILPGSVFQGTLTGQRTDPGVPDLESFSTVRFPQLHAGFRLTERWAIGAGFDGLLSHGSRVQLADTLAFREDTIPVVDTFDSTEGLSAFRAAVAFAASPAWSLGAGAVVYSGAATRTARRDFGGGGQERSTQAEHRWSYSGAGLTAGARWASEGGITISGAMESGGTLRVERSEATEDGDETSLRIPTTLSVGASSRITGDLFGHVGARWAGWEAHDGVLEADGGARDYLSLGGGIELRPRDEARRAFPLRVGYRWNQLPLQGAMWAEDGFVDEQLLSFGIGARLATGALRPDLTVERGHRSASGNGTNETFWRAILSLTVISR